MRRTLYWKFIFAYLILAILSLLVVTTLGRQLVENSRVRAEADTMYAEASRIAASHGVRYFSVSADLKESYENLQTIAAADETVIRVIATDGREIINTDMPYDPEKPHVIESFNYATFGPGIYEIGTFYDEYAEDCLSVICPVTSGVRVRGYIAITEDLTVIRDDVAATVRIMMIIAAVNFGLSFLILLFFALTTYRPMLQIMDGAKEFASGNLQHKIRVTSHDEMGYLADTLNLMAGELRKNNDYQKNFISNVSHDFRSPLTSIKGFSEAMLDGTIPPEMHDRYLGIIVQETERLNKLTNTILELNSMDRDKTSLNMSRFDINAMLKSTAAVFEGSCRKKKISINLVLTGTELFVRGDREKIEQVVYNLLDNAIKFSDRNSEVKIETTMQRGKCAVSVKDEGCGIARDDLTKIWDRFYKSDASRGRDRQGTGLGLSIVKEIINAHGQTISVVSTENVGTEFIFTLEMA